MVFELEIVHLRGAENEFRGHIDPGLRGKHSTRQGEGSEQREYSKQFAHSFSFLTYFVAYTFLLRIIGPS